MQSNSNLVGEWLEVGGGQHIRIPRFARENMEGATRTEKPNVFNMTSE